jgi:hypothetical protein
MQVQAKFASLTMVIVVMIKFHMVICRVVHSHFHHGNFIFCHQYFSMAQHWDWFSLHIIHHGRLFFSLFIFYLLVNSMLLILTSFHVDFKCHLGESTKYLCKVCNIFSKHFTKGKGNESMHWSPNLCDGPYMDPYGIKCA